LEFNGVGTHFHLHFSHFLHHRYLIRFFNNWRWQNFSTTKICKSSSRTILRHVSKFQLSTLGNGYDKIVCLSNGDKGFVPFYGFYIKPVRRNQQWCFTAKCHPELG